MLFVFYEDDVVGCRGFDTGNAGYFDRPVSNQMGTNGLGNPVQRALHGSNFTADDGKDESPEVSGT